MCGSSLFSGGSRLIEGLFGLVAGATGVGALDRVLERRPLLERFFDGPATLSAIDSTARCGSNAQIISYARPGEMRVASFTKIWQETKETEKSEVTSKVKLVMSSSV